MDGLAESPSRLRIEAHTASSVHRRQDNATNVGYDLLNVLVSVECICADSRVFLFVSYMAYSEHEAIAFMSIVYQKVLGGIVFSQHLSATQDSLSFLSLYIRHPKVGWFAFP